VRIQALTFDCWNTLLYEPDPAASHARRVEIVSTFTGVEEAAARQALDAAWARQMELWTAGVSSGAREIARETLARLGREAPLAQLERLACALAEAALEAAVLPLAGALETLEALARAGVRRALICDTGFSPGRVVRRLLERAGLLHLLEVHVFSDEAGVPKPHPRVFQQALAPLGVAPGAALHVGDLRRTDVAGARGAGLGSVRIRQHYDDVSEHPEADHVADSHAELLTWLRARWPG
jgi:putative hydrolase of the HAD superfamily